MDLDKICRACLEKTRKAYSLKGNVLNVQNKILEMLEYCLSRKLQLENLPDVICLPCFKLLQLSYDFLKKFSEAQNQLENIQSKCVLRKQYKNVKLKKIPENELKNIHLKNVAGENSLNPTNMSVDSCVYHDIGEIHSYAKNMPDSVQKELETENNMELESENVESSESNHDGSKDLLTEDGLSRVDTTTVCINIESTNTTSINTGLDGNARDMKTTSIQNNVMHYCRDYLKLELAGSTEPVIITRDLDDFPSIEQFIKYRCPMCSVQMKNGDYFRNHLLSHNRDNIECKWCTNKERIPVTKYIAHYIRLHKYQCVLCDKKVTSRYGLRYHMKLHKDARNYQCPIPNCKSAFALFAVLKRHILERHSDNERYKCPQCPLAFGSKDNLKYHKNKDHESAKHACSLCGRIFLVAGHLKIHKQKYCRRKNHSTEKGREKQTQ